MLSKIRFIFVLPFLFLIASTTYAQDSHPRHSDGFWQVAFWNNQDLAGQPDLTALHQSIDWDWGYGSPDSVIQKDHFSGRWSRTIAASAGTYRFTVTSDDGVRLYVDNQLLIDEWREQPASTYSADVPLAPGHHLIVVEYFEKAGLARLMLRWTKSPLPPPPVPTPSPATVTVDDHSAGFVKGGSATAWHVANEGVGGRMIYTKNNDRIRPKYNWARWYPQLDAGRYEVLAHIPRRHATAQQARYWVSHHDGYSLRVVNQGATIGWISLGTYRFDGNGREYVSLADVTFEPYLTRSIGFDAVMWVQR